MVRNEFNFHCTGFLLPKLLNIFIFNNSLVTKSIVDFPVCLKPKTTVLFSLIFFSLDRYFFFQKCIYLLQYSKKHELQLFQWVKSDDPQYTEFIEFSDQMGFFWLHSKLRVLERFMDETVPINAHKKNCFLAQFSRSQWLKSCKNNYLLFIIYRLFESTKKQ